MRAVTLMLVCLVLTGTAEAVNRIAIKAQASDEYVKTRARDKSAKVQTYQFMKGNYHPGTTSDPGMVEITFEDIVQNMAIHLQKQGYYALEEPGDSDLLFVVHYGRTSTEASLEEMLGYTSLEDQGFTEEVANAGAGGATLTASEMNATADFGFNMAARDNSANGGEMSLYYKAQLLGMEEAFFGDNVSPREELLLKTLLDEERYFIVLIAYDFQKLKLGKMVPLWTTRYSIRAIGQSFETAIQDLNFVAGDFFGKNLKGLTQKRVDDMSRVEMGEIEVISSQDEEGDFKPSK
jgi:hypothetical protein